jgi:hypothetical protein
MLEKILVIYPMLVTFIVLALWSYLANKEACILVF